MEILKRNFWRLLLICLLLSPTALLAQLEGGIITGNVSDASGAAIPNASVDVLNTGSGEHILLTSTGSGDFTSATLRPGTYTVTVTAPGFKTSVRNNIILEVGSRPSVNTKLEIGGNNETIQVDSQAPAMELTTATVGTVVEARPVQELPLNGRNALALTLETPAVRSNSSNNPQGFADRGTSLSAIVINNGPTGLNALLLDGQNNLNLFSGEVAINPATDAVQEFRVQSGYMPAEFGFTLGGVVALASKSGGNRFHGTAYEFFRNDYLDARNWFLDSTTKMPPLRYNQFGGAVGGPIIRDKLFFFGNEEEFRFKTSQVYTASVPTLKQRTGDFSDLFPTKAAALANAPTRIYDPNTTTPSGTSYVRTQFPGNKINRALDPVALAVQNAIYPEPNRTPTGDDIYTNTNNFQSVKQNVRSMRQALGRVDFRPTSKQSYFGRYAYYVHNTDNGSTNGSYLPSPIVARRYDAFGNQSLIIGSTYVFSPRVINELRASVTRTNFGFTVGNYNQDWPAKLGLPSNVPGIVFPTFTGTGLPAVNGQVGQRNTTNPQVVDIVTVTHGRHNFRFGGDWRIARANNSQQTTPSGNFSFSTALTNQPNATAGTGSAYASFLLGAVQSATQVVYRGNGFWSSSLSLFFQDDFKLNPRLTINMGLRWDYQPERHEHHNGFSNFNPDVVSPVSGLRGITQYAGVGGASKTFIPTNYTSFGPRFGVAWDVFGDAKTSLRAGFGIYYMNYGNQLTQISTSGFGTTTTNFTSTNPGIVPAFQLNGGFPGPVLQPLGAAGGPDFLLGQAAAYTPPQGVTPQSQQWNLNIQHEFPGRIVGEIGYLGNHGVHMIAGNYNLNQLTQATLLQYKSALTGTVTNPYAGKVPGTLGAAKITLKQSLLPFPYYNAITVTNPRDGNAHGDSMILTVQRHANSGLTLLGSYTFSKLLDDSVQDPLDGYIGISTAQGNVSYQDVFNRRAEYALDPADIKHRAVMSALYDLPFGKGKRFMNSGGLLNRVVGGWQANTVVTFQSGLPLAISGANNNAATRPDFVPGFTAADVNNSPTRNDIRNGYWFNRDVFRNPNDYTYGNVPRVLPNSRGPRYTNVDISVFKTTAITEGVKLQLRLEGFNAFNHPHYGQPNTSFVPAAGNNGTINSATFGRITSSYGERNVQLAAKILF